MATQPKKRKTQPTKPAPASSVSGNINIKGGVRGTGNVTGHQSHSTIQTPTAGSRSTSIRLVSFLLGLAGVIALIILLIRASAGLDASSIVMLVIAALVAVLGVIGVIKPEGVAGIFKNLSSK